MLNSFFKKAAPKSGSKLLPKEPRNIKKSRTIGEACGAASKVNKGGGATHSGSIAQISADDNAIGFSTSAATEPT